MNSFPKAEIRKMIIDVSYSKKKHEKRALLGLKVTQFLTLMFKSDIQINLIKFANYINQEKLSLDNSLLCKNKKVKYLFQRMI
jgi:hypothetical protein